jgi:sugar lactone lactonase YvrE
VTRPELASGPCAHHGEGIIWDPSPGEVRWVDMLAGDVLTLDERTGSVRRLHVGSVVAAIRPRASGGLVLALERGFATLDPGSSIVNPMPEIWRDPTVRMNDGACDPTGRFFCGSMAYDEAAGRGALYRLDPDGTVVRILESVTISNGLAWSADGSIAYYVDSATQRIDVFDYDAATGLLLERRNVVEIEEDDGAPDGLTIDEEGFIWVALWGGSAVRRYSPSGRLDGVIELPVRQVTACCFGGPELDVLYISTSRLGLDATREPEAGAVFLDRPGVRGLPPFLFAG